VAAALAQGAACVVVTGPPGTGKTALCRELAASGDDRTFSTAIHDSTLRADAVLRQLLREFGLVNDHAPGDSAHDATKLAAACERFLLSLKPLGAHAVVIVDDAEQVDLEVLVSLQRLMLAGEAGAKLLRLVLVGQASLEDRLQDSALAPLLSHVHQRLPLGEEGAVSRHGADVWTAAATGTSGEAVLVTLDGQDSVNRRWSAAAIALLAVAAAVAWVVTRVPDGQPPTAATSATATPLQGAPPAGGTAPPATTPTAPPGQNGAGTPAEVASPTPVATRASANGRYRIAVAAFRTPGRADQIASQLREQQIAVTIRPARQGEWYQVMAGPYDTLEQAKDVQRSLARTGFPDTEIAQPTDLASTPDSASR
jgi:hypothetical protein